MEAAAAAAAAAKSQYPWVFLGKPLRIAQLPLREIEREEEGVMGL